MPTKSKINLIHYSYMPSCWEVSDTRTHLYKLYFSLNDAKYKKGYWTHKKCYKYFMNFLYLKKKLSLDTVVYNADKLKKKVFPLLRQHF